MTKSNTAVDPLISVIIPTYNRANLLSRALYSVLSQTYPCFEIIIIDDGSTDNTSRVIASLTDPRIHYTKFDQNRGKSAALNQGIKLSKGRYITFLDDDDEFLPHTLKKSISAIDSSSKEIGLVVGVIISIKNGSITMYNRDPQPENLYYNQLEHSALALTGTLIKKKCFETVGLFNEKLFFGIDWEFMLRLLKKFKCLFINDILYKGHYPRNIPHITQFTKNNLLKRLNTYKIFLSKYYSEIKQYNRILAVHYFRIAQTLRYLNKPKLASKYYKLALKTNPKNLKYITHVLIGRVRNKVAPLFKTIEFLLRLMRKENHPNFIS